MLVVVLAGAWLGFRGWQVYQALAPVEPTLSGLGAKLADVDAAELEKATAGLPDAAARARSATSDPVWRLAEHLPWLGSQLAAVSAISQALDEVATGVLPALDDLTTSLDPSVLAPAGGRVDVGALAAAAPQVHVAAVAAAGARDRIAAVDTAPLVTALGSRVVKARDALGEVAGLLHSADQVLSVAPAMLGADGPRRYLLLVINPAELRSLGGIVGSLAVLTVDDGRITLGDYTTGRALGAFAHPVVPLSTDELALYGDRLGRFVQDATMSPDLPRAAEIATAMWRERTGEVVDGVVTIDPVALAALLRAVDGVQVGDVTLTAKNAARELLLDAYLRYPDPDASDAFFGAAAIKVFRALVDGGAEPHALLKGLRQSVDERRIGVWSAHPDEQAVLGAASVGETFLSGGQQDAAGVFLDDGTMTKIDYFLDVSMSTAVSCSDPGPATATITVDLTANTPDDIATMPWYVAGLGDRVGITQTNLTVYSPVGGRVLGVESAGVSMTSVRAEAGGRQATAVTTVLEPGQSQKVVVHLALPAGQRSLEVRTSPTVRSQGMLAAVSCGAP